MANEVTVNFSWRRPDKLGAQQEGIDRIDQTIVEIDAKTKAQDNAYTALQTSFTGHTHSWAQITGKPATIAGFGITDAYTRSETDAKVNEAVAALASSAPELLNTFQELAAALGNDPNFATTISSQMSLKLNASAYTAADVLAKLITLDGIGSGLDADRLDGLNSSEFVRSNQASTVSADIVMDGASRDKSYMGTYDPAKTQQIWSMGAAYRSSPTGADFGNLYGAAYVHQSHALGANKAGGHMFAWVQNGVLTAALGSGLWTSGEIEGLSVQRVKERIREIPSPLSVIRQFKAWIYDRTDTGMKDEVGLIAQLVRKAMPQLVGGNEETELLTVRYRAVTAMTAASVAELDAIVGDQALEIANLKARLAKLERQLHQG